MLLRALIVCLGLTCPVIHPGQELIRLVVGLGLRGLAA